MARLRGVAAAAMAALVMALARGEEDCAADEGAARKQAEKLRSQGDTALMGKRFKEAIQLYGEAIKAEPGNEKNYYKRYRAWDKTGNAKAGLADLNKAIEIKPDYLAAFAFRGKTLLALGRCPDAAKDYEYVLSVKPTHGDAKKLLPKALACAREIEQAEQLMAQGKYDLAEQKCTEAMEVTGKAPYVKLLRARARYNMGDYYEAIADAGDVLKKEKDDQDALLLRGMAYYRVADHEMAARHFREGLHKDPEHKETKTWHKRVTKIVKLTKRGDEQMAVHNHQSWMDALATFQEALEVDPSHVEHAKHLRARICKIYAKLRKVAEAKAACEAAISLDPAILEPYVTIADLLTRVAEETPDFELALRAWQRAHEVDRDDRQVREGMHKAEVGLKQSKQKNYYKILGVPRDADSGQIKRAYRTLAKEFHPDRHGDKGDEEKAAMESKFQLVAEAYEVLSSEELRGKYDRGEEVFENQGNSGGGRRHPFGHQRRHGFHW